MVALFSVVTNFLLFATLVSSALVCTPRLLRPLGGTFLLPSVSGLTMTQPSINQGPAGCQQVVIAVML